MNPVIEATGLRKVYGGVAAVDGVTLAVRRGEVSPYPYLNAWRAGHHLTPEVPGAHPPNCGRQVPEPGG
jgi:hypothetical protein